MNENTKLPNIVLITVDQWRGDCIGTLRGRHPVMTPHINQLAAEGILFTKAFADCPICMPQRVTTLTGQVASRFGMPRNFSTPSPVEMDVSLPRILSNKLGYQTKAIGKMHFEPERARYGFEHITLHPNDYVMWLEDTEYAGMYRGHGLGGNEVYPAVSAVPERFTHTNWVIDKSVRFLNERDPNSPFFLWIVFEAPHSPFDPPQPYDRMYDNFTIPEPIIGEWVDTEEEPLMFKEKRISHKFDDLNHEMIREARRRYYGQISHIDYQLGRFFGELINKKLYDDTIIIFTSDHGEHLGDHKLFGKNTFMTGSADVPLIMKVPSSIVGYETGQKVDTPVLTADIYPTILELTGLIPLKETDGISLMKIAKENTTNRVVCGEFGCEGYDTAFATDDRFKYIYYAQGGIEHLFDNLNDSQNIKNLSGDLEYEDVRKRLRNELISYLEKFNRPLVVEGDLIVIKSELNEIGARSKNPFAWRGPMRYGQGYSG
jgi:arylsulfatase